MANVADGTYWGGSDKWEIAQTKKNKIKNVLVFLCILRRSTLLLLSQSAD